MDLQNRLNEIWNKKYANPLPTEVKERGFCYCENTEQKNILVVGMNPSYQGDLPDEAKYQFSDVINCEYHYWKKVRSLLYSQENGIDLRDKSAYIDLFSFRESKQSKLSEEFLQDDKLIEFLALQVALTQEVIEEIIRPKLIIVHNKEVGAYFGRYARSKGWIWMGYEFEKVDNPIAGKELELYRIVGLIDDSKRVYKTNQSNLIGTTVLFYGLYDDRHEQTCPQRLISAQELQQLL